MLFGGCSSTPEVPPLLTGSFSLVPGFLQNFLKFAAVRDFRSRVLSSLFWGGPCGPRLSALVFWQGCSTLLNVSAECSTGGGRPSAYEPFLLGLIAQGLLRRDIPS